MAPIKVGIVGYGGSARIFHLPFILPNPDLEVYAFLQRAAAPQDKSSTAAGSHCTVDFPHAKHYRTPDEFFGDASIELVVVCTGHATHYQFARQALEAGKHVVVEKPFTVTSDEARSLIDLSKTHNKICTVFQNRRYDSDFQTLKHYIARGSFGQITEFANHYDIDNPPWMHPRTPGTAAQPGDGLLYGLGTHSIDQTIQLFGRPKSVTAFIRTLLVDNGADDSFTLILQYDNNLICTVKTTCVTPISEAKTLKYWVRGTHGVFVKNGEDVQIQHLLDGKIKVTDETFGVEPPSYHGYLTTRKDIDGEKFENPSSDSEVKFDGTVPSKKGNYVGYYQDVVAAIRGEKEVVCKAEEGWDVIRLIELAKESAEKGVTVPWS